MLLHAFEQRRLCAGRGAVDLIGKQNVREDSTRPEDKFPGLLVKEVDTCHIRRQQIRRKLDAAGIQTETCCQRSCKRGLAGAGDVIEQNMPACQQRSDHPVKRIVLPDDRALHTGAQGSGKFRNWCHISHSNSFL